MRLYRSLTILLIVCAFRTAQAAVTLNPLESDGMVLQRTNAPATTVIAGTALPNTEVNVIWPCPAPTCCMPGACAESLEHPVNTDSGGHWIAPLDGLTDGTPTDTEHLGGQTLRIVTEDTDQCANVKFGDPNAPLTPVVAPQIVATSNGDRCVIDITGVLVGEVILCTKQSNTATESAGSSWPLQVSWPWVHTTASVGNSHPALVDGTPAATGGWSDAVSSVCWAVGTQLQASLNVPVGLIEHTYSISTPPTLIWHWVGDSVREFPDDTALTELVQIWDAAGFSVSNMYDDLIAPLWPYTMRFVFHIGGRHDWERCYGGSPEPCRNTSFRHGFKGLVKSWRKDRENVAALATNFGRKLCAIDGSVYPPDDPNHPGECKPEDLPFLVYEMPGGFNIRNNQADLLWSSKPPNPLPGAADWFRSTLAALHFGMPSFSQEQTPQTWVVITSDLQQRPTHFTDRPAVAERIARIALTQLYQEPINDAWSGPSIGGMLKVPSGGDTIFRVFYQPGTAAELVGYVAPGAGGGHEPELNGFLCHSLSLGWDWATGGRRFGDQAEVICAGTDIDLLAYNRADRVAPHQPYGNIFNADGNAAEQWILDADTQGTVSPTIGPDTPTPTPSVGGAATATWTATAGPTNTPSVTPTPTDSGCQQAIVSTTPLAHWPFGEDEFDQTAVANDTSGALTCGGSPCDGIYYNGPQLGEVSLVGDATTATLFQVGDPSYFAAVAGTEFDVSAVTMAVWIRVDTAAAAVLYGRATDTTASALLTMNGDGTVTWTVGTGGGCTAHTITSLTSLADDAPHLLVGTYDGTTNKLYVDGHLPLTDTVGVALCTLGATAHIWGATWAGAQNATVTMQHALTFDRALTANEVASLATACGAFLPDSTPTPTVIATATPTFLPTMSTGLQYPRQRLEFPILIHGTPIPDTGAVGLDLDFGPDVVCEPVWAQVQGQMKPRIRCTQATPGP